MQAMSSDTDRGEPPFVFPDDKPRSGDTDGDGDVLRWHDEGERWEYRNTKKLVHNDIWHPINGKKPQPVTKIKILALRGE